jgi:VanZ family protein
MPPSLLWFRRLCWFGVVLWTAVVFTLSSLSGPTIGELNTFDLNDKLLHFAAFFAGALPLVPALRLTWRDWSWPRVIFTAVGVLSLYGALDEVHQMFTPSRSALDPWDWLADTLGTLTAAPLAAFIHAFAERKYRPVAPGN